jgi:hypothetical protein
MTDFVISVSEPVTSVSVVEDVVSVSVVESPVVVGVQVSGVQGVKGDTGATGATGSQGPSGVVSVTAPITNSGTSTSAVLGIDQTGLTLAQSQITDLLTALAAKANLAGGNSFTGAQTITGTVVTDKVLVVKGASGQSVNPFEVQTTAGAVLFSVATSGTISSGRVVSGGATGARVDVSTNSATSVGLGIRGVASQTANLQEWQISDGSVRSSISSNGFLTVGGSTPIANITSYAFGATQIPLAVRGAASQTANLQQWQDSSGNIMVRIESNGRLTSTGAANFNGFPAGSTFLGVQSNSASVPVSIFRGAASQTANLQEWQNSAGSILGRVGSNGYSYAQGFFTQDNSAGIEAQALNLLRRTAAFGSPGANRGALYFRDGTTTGTLKLVVRAGAAGAETTILDNIPQ